MHDAQTKLPDLSRECESFLAKAQEINKRRHVANLTLQHHANLLELLEIPQLMDTCVKNRQEVG